MKAKFYKLNNEQKIEYNNHWDLLANELNDMGVIKEVEKWKKVC